MALSAAGRRRRARTPQGTFATGTPLAVAWTKVRSFMRPFPCLTSFASVVVGVHGALADNEWMSEPPSEIEAHAWSSLDGSYLGLHKPRCFDSITPQSNKARCFWRPLDFNGRHFLACLVAFVKKFEYVGQTVLVWDPLDARPALVLQLPRPTWPHITTNQMLNVGVLQATRTAFILYGTTTSLLCELDYNTVRVSQCNATPACSCCLGLVEQIRTDLAWDVGCSHAITSVSLVPPAAHNN